MYSRKSPASYNYSTVVTAADLLNSRLASIVQFAIDLLLIVVVFTLAVVNVYFCCKS